MLRKAFLLFIAFWRFWPVSSWASDGSGAPELQQSCIQTLQESADWDEGFGDRKWGHFWISQPVLDAAEKAYSLQPYELKKAVQWILTPGVRTQLRHPDAPQFAMIEIPGRGRFRVQFRSRGPARGNRILGVVSTLDLSAPWTERLSMSPTFASLLRSEVYGWSAERLETQARELGADLHSLGSNPGFVIHFNFGTETSGRDLQIGFIRSGGSAQATSYDIHPLFYMRPNVREKLRVKHSVSENDVVEAFFNWDQRAVESEPDPFSKDPATRYWMIGTTATGRKLKIIFVWNADQQIPTLISAYDAGRYWQREFRSRAKKLP